MCEGAKKVPIKFDGFVIGSAFVSSDGHIVLAKLDSSLMSEEVREKLQAGSLDHISIKPRPKQ